MSEILDWAKSVKIGAVPAGSPAPVSAAVPVQDAPPIAPEAAEDCNGLGACTTGPTFGKDTLKMHRQSLTDLTR